MERNILYVDEDASEREKLSEVFGQDPELIFHTAGSIDEAFSLMNENSFRCLITEASFSDEDLGELLEEAASQDYEMIPILFTSKDFDAIPTEQMISFSAYVSKSNEDAHENIVEEVSSLLESQSEINYPVPENEEQRLEYLERFDVEEMAESGEFDRLARIGAEFFDTNWCFVGLVMEDRERFLSFQGSETEELSRDCAICTFAINQDDVMVVDDRSKDPRFKYVDELDDLGINWYAGAPMVTEEGYHVGSFCVADSEQKEFSEHEREMLKVFADEAMQKVELSNKDSRSLIEKLREIIWEK